MMKKEYPILFNAEMVQAILNGSKTQTRRSFTPKMLKNIELGVQLGECYPLQHERGRDDSYIKSFCPFGEVGDLLWVREAYAKDLPTKTGYAYRATYTSDELIGNTNGVIKWIPSIHMPKQACRLVLEIVDIRYEQLNEITETDAIAEGCDDSQSEAALQMGWYEKPVRAFRRLWEQVYGEKSWKDNPFVWVVEFKIHTPK